MDHKKFIRIKSLNKRKRNYFDVDNNFFLPLAKLVKKKFRNNKLIISIYYPGLHELNVLKIMDNEFFKKSDFLLPVIENNNNMNFYKWNKSDILNINKFGMLEPLKSNKALPDIILVPLLAFDNNKNRLGYGKGFYDKYLNKFVRKYKKILTVGVAFSFQKYHNLPVNKNDYKLDHIITEKGIL